MSKFQARCEEAFLDAFGDKLVDRVAERTNYIHYDVGTPDLTLFILADGGVQLARGDTTLVHLEEWDAKAPAELIERAIEECSLALTS